MAALSARNAVRSFVDVADVRTCRYCGGAYLRVVPDPDGLADYLQLEPFAARGCDVALGWRVQDARRWVVHVGGVTPDVYAFPAHKCGGGQSKGDRVSDPFANPKAPGSGGPSNAELQGKLVLLSVHRIERDIVTSAGVSDAVRTDIVDLTSGDEHSDSRLWGKLLVQQFEPGNLYVGRIDKGQAQPGKSAPWVFNPGDDVDKATASRYLSHKTANAPAPSASAPAPSFTPDAPAADKPPWA